MPWAPWSSTGSRGASGPTVFYDLTKNLALPRNEWVDPGSFSLGFGSAEVGRPSHLTVASAVSSRFVRAEATVRRKGLEFDWFVEFSGCRKCIRKPDRLLMLV